MSSSIEELIQETHAFMVNMWDSVTTDAPNLAELPRHVHESLNALFDKITNNGTLPSLEMPSVAIWVGEPARPPPPPPGMLSKLADKLGKYWLVVAAATLAGTAGTVYTLNPVLFHKIMRPVYKQSRRIAPLALLPPSSRPRKSAPGDHRKEAVIVLGADGLSRKLALDLEDRGFVVIATVSHHSSVDSLEKEGRGYLKALVLDPFQPSSVGPFLRSLSSALSLRFPLHSAGDPFSSPAQMVVPVAIVNCLALYGLEQKTIDDIELVDTSKVGNLVSTSVHALRGALPHVRNAASRPRADEGVVVSLLPASKTALSLPSSSLASMACASIDSFLHTLRRESLLRRDNLHFTTIQTGTFVPPSGTQQASQNNDLRRLNRRIFHAIVDGRGGIKSSVGPGALSYHLLSYLPHVAIDRLVQVQHRLSTSILARTRQADPPSTSDAPAQASTTPSGRRGPLPTPPSASTQQLPSKRDKGNASSVGSGASSTGSFDPTTSDEEVSSSSYAHLAESTGSFIAVDHDPFPSDRRPPLYNP